jgi:POT family proton-dependent oligopeptide transporter
MTEMWERFSYYGIRPLLILFMTTSLMNGGFGFDRPQASAIVGIYAASVYFSIPSRRLDSRQIVGVETGNTDRRRFDNFGPSFDRVSSFAGGKLFFFLGLVLIVFGTGLLKPNISAIVGDLYPESGARRDAGFSIFYMGINLGAFLGQIVTGFLGEKYGYHWGFGAAGVGMLFGLIWFATRARSTLGNLGVEITRDPDPEVQKRRENKTKIILFSGLAVLVLIIALAATGVITINPQSLASNMTYFLVGIAVAYFAYLFIFGKLSSAEKKRVVVIAVLFVAAAIFWAAFEQAPTSLNLFAKDFTERTIGSFEVPATWFQSINSLFIIIFAPIFAAMWTKTCGEEY